MKMLIGGNKVDASDGRTFDVVNPATGEFIDTVPMATAEDIDQAVRNAKIGQKEWAAIPIVQREKIFDRFQALLEEHRRELIVLSAREMGKSAFVANFEIEGVMPMFRSFVPRKMQPWIYLFIAVTFQLSGGVYLGTLKYPHASVPGIYNG